MRSNGFTEMPAALYARTSSSRFFNASRKTISSVLPASSLFMVSVRPRRTTLLKSSLSMTAFFIISSAFTSPISMLTIWSGFCITGVAETSIVRLGEMAAIRFCEVSACKTLSQPSLANHTLEIFIEYDRLFYHLLGFYITYINAHHLVGILHYRRCGNFNCEVGRDGCDKVLRGFGLQNLIAAISGEPHS